MRTTINPLYLQEIVILVGKYLSRSQIASAIRICRVWYDALSPYLYRNIAWDNSKYPTQESILSNAGFTQSLEISIARNSSFSSHRLFTLTMEKFNHLSQLCLTINYPNSEMINLISKLIIKNPGLKEIQDSHGYFINSLIIVESLLSCKYLRKLSVSDLNMTAASDELIRQLVSLFTMIEDLEIMHSLLPTRYFLDNNISYPLLKTLRLDRIFPSNNLTLDFIEKCPHLQSLLLDQNFKRLSQERVNLLFKVHCTKITDITLRNDYYELVPPDILEAILNSISSLSSISLYVSDLDNLDFECLSRHYKTLTSIDLGFDPNSSISSFMVQDMLELCPNLVSLCAREIKADDFVQAMSNQSENLTLRELRVYIYGCCPEMNEWQSPVMDQLAKLKNLEVLDIGVCPLKRYLRQEEKDYKCGVEFRFDGGLKKLQGLNRLELISCQLWNKIYGREILWMTESWPDLREFLMDAYCKSELVNDMANAFKPYHINVSKKTVFLN